MVSKPDEFLEDAGLASQSYKPYSKKTLHIDKGEIDPRSMGGIAVVCKERFDKKAGLLRDELAYWAVHPDGLYERHSLFEIERTRADNGRGKILSVSVLGREVSVHNTMHVNVVKEAMRRIMVGLRDTSSEVPHVAKIFKDCKLEDIVGERLPLPGFDLEQRIYFPATNNFNLQATAKNKPEISLPVEAFMPLAGMRKNTLDTDHSYLGRDFLKARGAIDGKRFEIRSEKKKIGQKKNGKKRKLEIRKAELDARSSNDNGRLIAKAKWTLNKDARESQPMKMAHIKALNFGGYNMLSKGFHEAMAAIGAVNKMHSDMFNSRDYPFELDHLAAYGLLETAGSSSPPPTHKGRFVLVSAGGVGAREDYPGIGGEIGGNSKLVKREWKDKRTGETKRMGAILDMGSYLIKNKAEWDMGHPDLVEALKYSKDIFIGHHHIDHKNALLPYIARGIINESHTIHCTPEVYEMIKDMLDKSGVSLVDAGRPKIDFLEGAGVMDLKGDDGVVKMSVAHGADAVPHTARCTPFIVYGCEGDEILGSYMYMGDMRYDEEWFAAHDSAFWDPSALMLAHNPNLDPQHCIPAYTELDGTSAMKEGRTKTEAQAHNDRVHIMNSWFHDRHVAMPIIGTADGRAEHVLRDANRTGRKVTAFGAAVTFLFGKLNKWGANPYLVERPEAAKSYLKQTKAGGLQPYQLKTLPSSLYTGLKDYLKWHAGEHDLKPTEYRGRGSKTVKNWFKNDDPGSILAVLSGSQGNDIEFESMTYKLSEGRSFWDADVRNSVSATPTDLKDWAIIFSQTAIPGNEKHQQKLIKKLAARGSVVVEALDNAVRVHNAGDLTERIISDLVRMDMMRPGDTAEKIMHSDGSLYVEGLGVHASGHPKKEDLRLWIRKLTAKTIGVMHYSNPLAARAGQELIEEEGRVASGVNCENNLEIQITNDTVELIGKRISSVVASREESEPGKHYNKQLKVKRFANLDGYHEQGLRGSVGGFTELSFGVEDAEAVRKRNDAAAKKETVLIHSSKTHAKPRRRYKGMIPADAPEWNPDHPILTALEI